MSSRRATAPWKVQPTTHFFRWLPHPKGASPCFKTGGGLPGDSFGLPGFLSWLSSLFLNRNFPRFCGHARLLDKQKSSHLSACVEFAESSYFMSSKHVCQSHPVSSNKPPLTQPFRTMKQKFKLRFFYGIMYTREE